MLIYLVFYLLIQITISYNFNNKQRDYVPINPINNNKKQIVNSVISNLLIISSSLLYSKPSFANNNEVIPNKGFQTRSGLVYFDIIPPNNSLQTPRYGQLISFYYHLYYRNSLDSPLVSLDSNFPTNTEAGEPFLTKHGNGRVIRGIDEALHTMTIGSKRRLIIPNSIGYTDIGLGPLPVDPFKRRKLGDTIDLLINNRNSQLIADVQLVYVGDDENDQGYYEDIPISQDEIKELVRNARSNNTTINLFPKLN